MKNLETPLIVIGVILALLLMLTVLLQTPKATGLGGTIGGGGDGIGGGYRTRRGLERQLYWTSWVIAGAWFLSLIAYLAIQARFPA